MRDSAGRGFGLIATGFDAGFAACFACSFASRWALVVRFNFIFFIPDVKLSISEVREFNVSVEGSITSLEVN